MIRKKIKYTDFDGNEVEENFYFNLTKAELMELEISEPGGMRARIERMGESQDPVEVLGLFRKIVQVSIGDKRPDGKFVKSADFADAFLSSDAYSELFLKIMQDVDEASQFITGLMPADLINEVSKAVAETGASTPEPTKMSIDNLSREEIEELKKALLSKED